MLEGGQLVDVAGNRVVLIITPYDLPKPCTDFDHAIMHSALKLLSTDVQHHQEQLVGNAKQACEWIASDPQQSRPELQHHAQWKLQVEQVFGRRWVRSALVCLIRIDRIKLTNEPEVTVNLEFRSYGQANQALEQVQPCRSVEEQTGFGKATLKEFESLGLIQFISPPPVSKIRGLCFNRLSVSRLV